jgi:hypothetical protein
MRGDTSYEVIRAIRGPVTLITLGALFALQNFTNVGFDKTWPVLLIVFGLLSLLQRGAAPPRPAPMPPTMPPPPRGYSPTGYSGSSYAQPPAGSTPPPSSGAGSAPSQGGAA